MKHIPLGTRVLIRILKEEQKENVILMPDSVKERDKKNLAIVEAMGRLAGVDKDYVDRAFNIGNKVIFKSYSAQKVSLDDSEDYFIIESSEILCVIEE